MLKFEALTRTIKFFVAIGVYAISLNAIAEVADSNRELKKDRPQRKGNERSKRMERLAKGEVVYGGNGCPEGTMRIAFAPDNLSFSILFDQFVAEVSDVHKKAKDVLMCEMLVPIDIPEGMQMEITRVDFRGYVNLPKKTKAQFNSVFNFRGRGGDKDKLKMAFSFRGPSEEDFELSSDVLVPEGRTPNTEISPCGGRVELRIAQRMSVFSEARGESAMASLDSIDGKANAIYYVNWRECQREAKNRR